MSESALLSLAERLGRSLCGGEFIELIGDVGAGKTTFTRGLARGLGIIDDIQSPTFTISRIYATSDGRRLAHYDFYRLQDAGILAMEIEETLQDNQTITVVEWGEIVAGVLPENRITIHLVASSEDARDICIFANGEHETVVMEQLL